MHSTHKHIALANKLTNELNTRFMQNAFVTTQIPVRAMSYSRGAKATSIVVTGEGNLETLKERRTARMQAMTTAWKGLES